MDQADIPALLGRLKSEEDAVRKMAVFKLQSSINDPSFADVFISSGGLTALRKLIMTTSGNTLAYSLQSLSRLLEVDMGWETFESAGAGELVERLVELIVNHPLVNILRGAMSILGGVVGHPQSAPREAIRTPGAFGFRALKPAVAVYPQFFEMVVAQLSSADHLLCANALMLLNALMRDVITDTSDSLEARKGSGNQPEEDWPKFVKKLQDLGVIKSAYGLMQSSALQDLAHPLLEFQSLTKILLRKWRDVRFDLERPDHRRSLKAIHLVSAPEKSKETKTEGAEGKKEPKKHNPEKWRRLGFETESPASEFGLTGYLGMMDLSDFVKKQEDSFQKLLLEQATRPMYERCPIARASLAVTAILYEHFDVDKSDSDDAKNYLVLDGIKNYDKIFRPLLLQWPRLHTASLLAFFRLWKATGAEQADFERVAELARILIEQVVGQATRTKDIAEAEEELAEFEYARLRELQMELLELSFEDEWGHHLLQVREELNHEALQFVKEQRIRCLLAGSWFPRGNAARAPALQESDNQAADVEDEDPISAAVAAIAAVGLISKPWRYAKLSHNRRHLHYEDFAARSVHPPGLEALREKIDLTTISSVVSNVSANGGGGGGDNTSDSLSSTVNLQKTKPTTTTKITINSFVVTTANGASQRRGDRHGSTATTRDHKPGESESPAAVGGATGAAGEATERPILTLMPSTHSLASEWLDGLLMLLGQAPITAETNKLVHLVSEYGLKIRLLNVRLDDGCEDPGMGATGLSSLNGTGRDGGGASGKGVVPSREGLDEDYFYEV